MTSDELHDLLRQVWNRDFGVDEAYDELELIVYDERQLRADLKRAREQRNQYKERRDAYKKALVDLLHEAEAFENQSKHLARECREVRELLGHDE